VFLSFDENEGTDYLDPAEAFDPEIIVEQSLPGKLTRNKLAREFTRYLYCT
jgi:hypothetical protein